MQSPSFQHRVCLGDTDAAGVIYFARALDVAHRAYEEALQAAGLPLAGLLAEGAWALPVVRSECDYRRAVRLGEVLGARVGLRSLGERSARVQVALDLLPTAGDTAMAPSEACRLLLIVACLDRGLGASAPFPPLIREALLRLPPMLS